MRVIVLLLICVLASCKGKYEEKYQTVLDAKFGTLYKSKVLDSKQITQDTVLGKAMLHHLTVEFRAVDDIYKRSGESFLDLALKQMEDIPQKYKPGKGVYIHFGDQPDISKLFKGYQVLESFLKKDGSVTAKVELVSLIYDDGSVKMDKTVKVKEIVNGDLSAALLSSPASLVGASGMGATQFISGSDSLNEKIVSLVSEAKKQIAAYELKLAQEKKQQEEKARAIAEEKEQVKALIQQQHEDKIAAELQVKIDFFNSKTAKGEKYSGYLQTNKGVKEVILEFTENKDNGAMVKAALKFKENPEISVNFKGFALTNGSKAYEYLALHVEEASLQTDPVDPYFVYLNKYLKDKYISVVSLRGKDEEINSAFLQSKTNSTTYYSHRNSLKIKKVKN